MRKNFLSGLCSFGLILKIILHYIPYYVWENLDSTIGNFVYSILSGKNNAYATETFSLKRKRDLNSEIANNYSDNGEAIDYYRLNLHYISVWVSSVFQSLYHTVTSISSFRGHTQCLLSVGNSLVLFVKSNSLLLSLYLPKLFPIYHYL